MDDSLTAIRPPGIQALLTPKAPATQERKEGGDPSTLPESGGQYQACARAANKELTAVHFLLKDRSIRTNQYCHLDSDARYLPMDETGRGSSITLRFTGTIVTDVKIEGRNLRLLYDHLTQHRMPWLSELPDNRDFEPETDPVINRILFIPVGSAER